MSKKKTDPLIETLAAAPTPAADYVCSKVYVQVLVDRWHGKRKTGEYMNQQPIPISAQLDEAVPFSVELQEVVERVIASIKEDVESGAMSRQVAEEAAG